MLEKAIARIEKQIELYRVQDENLRKSFRRFTIEGKVKDKLKEEIKLWEYILKVLKEHKKEGIDE